MIADLKASADGKDLCGLRLGCWFSDLANGLAPPKQKREPDAVCVLVKGK